MPLRAPPGIRCARHFPALLAATGAEEDLATGAPHQKNNFCRFCHIHKTKRPLNDSFDIPEKSLASGVCELK